MLNCISNPLSCFLLLFRIAMCNWLLSYFDIIINNFVFKQHDFADHKDWQLADSLLILLSCNLFRVVCYQKVTPRFCAEVINNAILLTYIYVGRYIVSFILFSFSGVIPSLEIYILGDLRRRSKGLYGLVILFVKFQTTLISNKWQYNFMRFMPI